MTKNKPHSSTLGGSVPFTPDTVLSAFGMGRQAYGREVFLCKKSQPLPYSVEKTISFMVREQVWE